MQIANQINNIKEAYSSNNLAQYTGPVPRFWITNPELQDVGWNINIVSVNTKVIKTFLIIILLLLREV